MARCEHVAAELDHRHRDEEPLGHRPDSARSWTSRSAGGRRDLQHVGGTPLFTVATMFESVCPSVLTFQNITTLGLVVQVLADLRDRSECRRAPRRPCWRRLR